MCDNSIFYSDGFRSCGGDRPFYSGVGGLPSSNINGFCLFFSDEKINVCLKCSGKLYRCVAGYILDLFSLKLHPRVLGDYHNPDKLSL